MCDCENNVVDLQQLKIYTIMAKYKPLSNKQISGGGRIVKLTSASQEELAFVHETLGLTDLVEKTEKTKTRKSDAKKVSKVKEETNDSEKESGNEEKDQE
jgi:hypothetical protein|tara:strand:- start:412 stop:711 length:300 start_codon:yes stop_codon:yes gene_type:complete